MTALRSDRHPRGSWLLTAACLAAATACGSTVQQSGTLAGSAGAGVPATQGLGDSGLGTELGQPNGAGAVVGTPGSGDGFVGDGSGGVPGVPGAGPTDPGSGQGVTPGGPPATTQGPGVGDQPGGSPAPGVGSNGPGVSATSINLGLPVQSNGKAAAAAFGATGAGAGGGDGKRIWNIVLASVNNAGGVLGRKLVPVFHEFDATSQEPYSSQEQAACETWTRDNKVLWVAAAPSKTLVPCLNKAGVAQSSASLTDVGTAFYETYPYYVEVAALQLDRAARALPGRLDAQQYFAKWDTTSGKAGGAVPAKVGIVAFQDPRTDFAVDKLLVPALQRITRGKVEVVKIATPTSAGENGTAISAIQSATLRFRQAGVTHVLPFESSGAGIGVFFAQGAENQKYYPRYGLTSGNAAQLAVDFGLWPKSQVNGAVGFGWLPLLDVRDVDNRDDGPESNAARRSCLGLMTKGGVDTSAAVIKRQALQSCDTVRLLKAALEAGGKAVNRDTFLAGVNRLGTSFESGLTFGTSYSAARHDGVGLVRQFAYQPQPGCECFRYTSPRTPIG